MDSCIIYKCNYWVKSEHFLPAAALAARTGQGPEPLAAFAGRAPKAAGALPKRGLAKTELSTDLRIWSVAKLL